MSDMHPYRAPELDAQAECRCGRKFTPRWISGLKKWSRFCDTCSLLNLAKGMEYIDPTDSLADISAGEQLGAAIRDVAAGKGPTP